MIDFKQLIDAGLHFGHQKSRWCPKMKSYIWGHRGGIHLIDISKTAQALQKTATFLESVVSKGETVLWVGTKKSAKDMVEQVGNALNMPYVDYRWVGGTLTNFHQVKKAVTKLLHYEDIIEKANDDNSIYTKKEIVGFQKRADRLKRSVGGLRNFSMPIGAIVLIDVKKEQTALFEANVANIPVVALVDSNSDPSGVDFVIPGNDDSSKGIKFVLEYLQDAAKKGQAKQAEVKKQQKKDAELKAAAKKDASAQKATTEKKVAKPAAKKVEKKPAAKAPAKKAAAKTSTAKKVEKKTETSAKKKTTAK